MFICHFFFTVYGKDAYQVVTRRHELPFVPQTGQRITFDPSYDDVGHVIARVVAVLSPGVRGCEFWVFLHSWEEEWDEDLRSGEQPSGAWMGCECLPEDDCCSLQNSLSEYIDRGWIKEGPRRDGVPFIGAWVAP